MHRKARESAADVVMLDLEDSVPLEAKLAARGAVIESVNNLDWGSKTLTVRVNGFDTPFGFRDLLEVAREAAGALSAVVIPKVDEAADIHFASRLLDGIEMERGADTVLGIEATIESARGMQNIGDIAAASPRLVSLVFGIADYSASIGARLVSLSGHGEAEEQIYPGHRWNFALSRVIMAAKAHDLLAIDAPYGNFKDPQGLQRAASMSCALGCDGKWAIHPDQIETINRVFSPSPEEIARAKKILDGWAVARKQGLGAAAVDGRMIDQATVRLARRLWDQARQMGLV
jgi:citrate lyase beta subunit